MAFQVFIAHQTLCKRKIGYRQKNWLGDAIRAADALSDGEHGQVFLLIPVQEHGIGQGGHILVQRQAKCEFGGKITQGTHRHLAGVLIDDDDRFSQFPDFSHDDIGDVFL